MHVQVLCCRGRQRGVQEVGLYLQKEKGKLDISYIITLANIE